MKKLTYLSITFGLLFCLSACHDQRKGKNLNQQTQVDYDGVKFLKDGQQDGLAEIKAATIAEQISKNPNVISYAKMLITAHTAINGNLDTLARKDLVTLTDSISDAQKQMLATLNKNKGAGFDKEYMQMMVVNHEKAISLFKMAGNNSNPGLQGFAVKTLPMLQSHLDSAKTILAALK